MPGFLQLEVGVAGGRSPGDRGRPRRSDRGVGGDVLVVVRDPVAVATVDADPIALGARVRPGEGDGGEIRGGLALGGVEIRRR